MKGYNKWSYAPYRPLMSGDGIYICRIVPYQNKMHFEWLGDPDLNYSVYLKEKEKVCFQKIAVTKGNCYDIENLEKKYRLHVLHKHCG